jgi:hypothetical protein
MGFVLLLLYITGCYLHPAALYPELVPYRPMFWLGWTTAGMMVFELFRGGIASLKAPQCAIFAVFVGLIGFSQIAQGWYGGAMQAIVDFTIPAAIFYMLALCLNSMSRLRVLAGVLVATFLILTVQSLIGYITDSQLFIFRQGLATDGFQREFDDDDAAFMGDEALDALHPLKRVRSLGFLNDPNDFGQALLVVLPFVARLWVGRGPLSRFFVVVLPLTLFVVAILLTHSRGALIGVLALLLLAVYDRWGPLPTLFGSAIGGLGILGAKLAGGRSYSLQDASNYGRIDAWSAGLEMVKSHPLFGVGYNGFLDHHEITAHNSFVLCFAELGLTGYIVWLCLLSITLLELFRLVNAQSEPDENDNDAEVRSWANALRYSLCGFLVTAFFLSRTYTITLYLILGMCVALFNVSKRSGIAIETPVVWDWTKWAGATGIAILVAVYVLVRLGHLLGMSA